MSPADRLIAAAQALNSALGKKKQGINDSTMQSMQSLSRMFVDTAEREAVSSWKEEETTQGREPPPPATSPLLATATVHKIVEPRQPPPMALQPEPRLSPLLTFAKTRTGKAS